MTCESCERLKEQLHRILHPVHYEPPHDSVALNYLVNRHERTSNLDYCGDHKVSLPLMMKANVSVDYFSSTWKAKGADGKTYLGDTDLMAAMRCYVGNYCL